MNRFHLNRTPLHEAISRKEWDLVTILMHFGANVHLTNSDGLTPRGLGMALGHTVSDVDSALGLFKAS